MTTTGFFSILWRRWYVGLLGLLITLLGTYSLLTGAGVYWSQVDVVFLAPKDPAQVGMVTPSRSVVAMAGLVERKVNAGRPVGAATAAEVALVDTGVQHGSSIQLPNSGGQWTYAFVSPLLSVQAVGSTPHEVDVRRSRAVAAVDATLREIQVADGIGPRARITTRLSPREPAVVRDKGHPSRAAGVAAFMGLGITGSACVLVDRWLVRRWRRKQPAA